MLSYGDFTQPQDNLQLQRDNYLDLAARLQRIDLAHERLQQMEQRIDELRRDLLEHFSGELPRVTLIRFASATQVYIFGPNSLPQHAMTLLGLQPAQAVPVSRWGNIQAPVTQLGTIEDGDTRYQAGDFIWRDASHAHSPRTPDGCLCYTVQDAPVHFTKGLSRLLNGISHRLY